MWKNISLSLMVIGVVYYAVIGIKVSERIDRKERREEMKQLFETQQNKKD